MAVPYTFGTATASIPLSQLDSNFATTITLGNTAIQLGNTVTTLNNMTLANVTVSSGNVTFTNVSTTTANVTTANITTEVVGTSTITTAGITTANVTTANVSTALSYSGTLTGGTGIVNLGSGQFYKDASGNVGINNSAPDRKLYINGGARTGSLVSNIFAISDGSIYTFDIPISTSEVSLRTNLNNLSFQTVNAERMRIDSSGNVGIGTTSPSASAILDAQSTTKGVRMPNMTTTQKNAISSPAAGLMVFDTTLAKLCVYSGSAWQTITSV